MTYIWPYIDVLAKAEKTSEASLMWSHTGDGQGLWVSTCGYIMQEHMDLEAKLLKAGCRYDTSKGIQEFCRENGRTTTFFKLK